MAQPARRSATLADLLAIPEGGRSHEVIDGELVQRASPTFDHGSAQRKVGALVDPFERRTGGPGGSAGWWFASETEIFFAEDQIYRPDIAGWRRDRSPQRPSGFPVRVIPDWVCEVLSPGNARNDRVTKLRGYQRSRVGHYWMVDVEERTLIVQRWTADGYLTVLAAGRGETVRAEPFDAIPLVVSDLFGDEDAPIP